MPRGRPRNFTLTLSEFEAALSSPRFANSRALSRGHPGVLSDDGLTVLFTHPGDAQWTEVVPVEHLEESPEAPKPRRRGK